jgi:serine protease AprX
MTLTLRRRSFAVVAALAALMSAAVTTATAQSSSGPTAVVDPALRAMHGSVAVIVSGSHAAERAVVKAGGTITRELAIIGGFAAKVPADDLTTIARVPGVRSITYDGKMTVQGSLGGGTTSGAAGPADVYKKVTHASGLQSMGYSGQGVVVALIDTGVSPLPDVASQLVHVAIDPAGDLANCVNFSGTATCDDQYGHGTFLAGLIAGTGASSNGQYVGVAPQAKILSIKIAGADGSADVSNVIAALQWVVAFKNIYGIDVLNLSLGTDSTQPYMLSPLDFAVEKVWQSGVVVDVSASNLGPGARTIDKPADDPFVITVGAVDDLGTVGTGDDVVPNFSSRGPTAADGLAKPDVTAPGAHLVSLDAPGSAIATNFPSTMTAPYRRGSGTSMSNAVVSGLVADLLSANPNWSPNRVKFALMSTARTDASNDWMSVGAGLVDGTAALTAPPGVANTGVAPSLGTGSLTADRGSVQVQLAGVDGTVIASPLSGQVTAQLTTWDPTSMLFATLNGASWYGASWYGASWYGASWYGASWYGASWYGASWYGQPEGASWYGASWYGASWYGAWDQ